jgi:hypothetical protein
MIAALILGRKGSQGFPGKNTLPVLGRPLCAYPLLAAANAALVDETWVSTDDPAIAAIARQHGAGVIDRPARLATPQALGEDAYLHGYEHIRDHAARRGQKVEMMVLLFCNAATILADTLDKGIALLRQDQSADSAVTVSRYNMWSPLRARRKTGEGLLEPFVPFETFGDPATLNCDRDSQGDVWFADMSASIVRPHCLERMDEGLLPQRWMGRRIAPLEQWGGCDVDYAWQVPGVEYWLTEHGFTPTATPYDREEA